MILKTFYRADHTFYCQDNLLFGTYVGVNCKNSPLHYTVWGKNEIQSKKRADRLVDILNNTYLKNQ